MLDSCCLTEPHLKHSSDFFLNLLGMVFMIICLSNSLKFDFSKLGTELDVVFYLIKHIPIFIK